MKNEEILRKLRSVELCMCAHPDYEKGSEFEDRIIDLQEIQKALTIPDVSFPLFQEFYGQYVHMTDRFETVHVWSKELAIKNKGRWKPIKISKERYLREKD